MKKTKTQKIISIVVMLSFLLSMIPTSAFAENNDDISFLRDWLGYESNAEEPVGEAPGETYGPFKNVKHKITLDEGHDELCKREMTGELTFDWPEPSTYMDVVFIQDFSGSFDNTIESVGVAVNKMIDSLNMGTDEYGNPKDRAMIVTFRDCSAYAGVTADNKFFTKFDDRDIGKYYIGGTELTNNKGSLQEWVTNYYNSNSLAGGTPTVDGMVEAQARYKRATSGDEAYNRETYEVNGHERKRKTVYVLITDGAANSAKWSNLSSDAKAYMGFGNIAEWDNYMATTSKSYLIFDQYNVKWKVENYYKDIPFLWSDERRFPDGTFYYVNHPYRTEAYGAMLLAMKSIASDMRSSGGLKKYAGGRTGATVVTAFWEDKEMLTTTYTGYGKDWNKMSTQITNAMLAMTGNHPEYVAKSDTNIEDFSEKLVTSFKTAATPVLDQVSITAISGLSGTDYSLLKKNPTTGEYQKITPGAKSQIIDQKKLIIDMSSLEPGSYKITYKLKEDEFKGEEYSPTKIKMIFDGNGVDIATDPNDANKVKIAKNNRTDCEITLNKKVSLIDQMPAEGGASATLEKQRQHFYFNTNYTFTRKVFEAVNSMVIEDVIDDRLEVLDAWILAANDAAKLDAVSGATAKGTLIAEYKGGDNNHYGVPEITQEGQKLSFALPAKPAQVGGVMFPYGAYTDKQYTLAVKVRLKDSVTDADIELMHALDPVDNKKKGIPNRADLYIDGVRSQSNKVKALPPKTVPPTISKYVETDKTTFWSPEVGEMSDESGSILFSLDVLLPEDTTGYNSLVIEDQLDTALEFSNEADNLVVACGEVDLNQELINPEEISSDKYVVSKENGNLILTITDKELLTSLASKTLSIEFKAKVKNNHDVSGYYNASLKRFEIPNSSKVKANDFSYSPSNEVKVVWSPSTVTLKKKAEGVTPDTFLPGAQFSVKEEGEGGEARTVTTGSDGSAEIDELVPGKIYVVKEIKAPAGYIAEGNTSWKIEVSPQGKIKIKKYTGESEEGESIDGTIIVAGNVKPEVPMIEKSLKGERKGAAFYKPDEEDPYKMTGIDECITYEVKVPIHSVAGYHKLEISDTVDDSFTPDGTSLKAYTHNAEGHEVPLTGNFKTTGKGFIWTKTTDFDQIKDCIIIRFSGRLNENAWKALFAGKNNGKVRNKATLKLNDGQEVDSNTVVSQVTRGRVSITKHVQGERDYIPMPAGLSANFVLYKKIGDQDAVNPDGSLTTSSDGKADKFIADITVKGGDSPVVTTENLDPGDYYYVETTAPAGYAKANGKLPKSGYLTVPATGGLAEIQETTVKNDKAQNPTIAKMVKGDRRDNYSTEDYQIDIGEVWRYAIDVYIPTGVDVNADYIVTDEVNKKVLTVVTDDENKPTVKTNKEDINTFAVDTNTDGWLKEPTGWNASANDIKLVIPSTQVNDYIGKTIRIELKVKNKGGKSFLKEGVLVNGKLPNTAILHKRNGSDVEIGRSTVNIVPKILRDVTFDKTLGGEKLSGADFALYPYDKTKSLAEMKAMGIASAPFTNEPFRTSSMFNGRVSFKNVPVGEYALVEERAPSGTLLPYEYIHLVVNSDATISEDSDDAVIFQTPDGRKLTGHPGKQLWNNELITFPVTKIWKGDDKQNVRPEKITVALYRKGADAGEPERLGDIELPHEGKWTYTFESGKDSLSGKKLYKYGIRTNEEYTYYVKEERVPEHYISEKSKDGHTITNTLKTHTLRLVKQDGDKVAAGEANPAIKGTTFILTGPNGETKEAQSDNLGVIEFADVKEGVRYVISEKETDVSKDYIVNTGTVIVYIGADGKPRFTPDAFPLIDPDDDTNNNSGYRFLNYKKPIPTKKVNGKDEYELKNYTEPVTYTIEVPVKGTGDIKEIKVTDKVDEAMRILPQTFEVYEKGHRETSLKDFFQIRIGANQRSITYTATGQTAKGFANKTLVFEFKAQISVGPEKLAQLHPKGSIPNTGSLILNNKPMNEIKTNEVKINTDFYTITLQKKLQQTEGLEAIPANVQSKATFDLIVCQGVWDDALNRPETDKDDIVVGSYETDENGRIIISHLPKGNYRFVETKAPAGYVAVRPQEVTINDQSPKEITLDVEDPHVDLPTLNKMVKGEGEVAQLEKSHLIPTWNSYFTYVVDIEVPQNASYLRTTFLDSLPAGIVVDSNDDITVALGDGSGDSFVKDENNPINQHLDKIKPMIQGEEEGRQMLCSDSWAHKKDGVDGSAAILKAMKGKTLRFTYKAHIKDGYNNIRQFGTDEDGYIVNTAHLIINDNFDLSSDAKVKPADQYGLVIQKIADFNRADGSAQPLAGAVFELQKYILENENGTVEEGPDLPPGITTEYISDKDGYITIDKRLITGAAVNNQVAKYRLVEKTPPYEYTDENGKVHVANFSQKYQSYILHVGVELDDGKKGIRLTGITDTGNGCCEKRLFEGESTKENPAQIVNRQQIIIPVKKIWNDEDDRHGKRPKTITFTLQRAIVNGVPDKVQPDGNLVPVENDEADTIDEAFNQAAETKYCIPWSVTGDGFSFAGEDLHGYSEDGKKYNYYVKETTLDDYTAEYKKVATDPALLAVDSGISSQTVQITNTLKSGDKLILKKVDDSENPQAVKGAMFNLIYTLADEKVNGETKTTGENGEIDFGTLAPGRTYTLTEVEAPAGYQKNDNVYTIVVDGEGNVKVYTTYNDPESENVEVIAPDFVHTPATEGENAAPGFYTLSVVDKKLTTPEPVKKVNGEEEYALKKLNDKLTYTVEVPVGSVEGMTKFELEDDLHKLLQFVSTSEDVEVEADGKDMKSYGEVTIDNDNQKITFTMTKDFDKIANRTVKLTFEAKVKDSYTTVEALKEAMNTAGDNNAAITYLPNTATVKFNDKPSTSNETRVTPGDPGEKPTIEKKVNDVDHYDMNMRNETVAYTVKVPVPENVMGYNSLAIKDEMANILEMAEDGITLYAQTYNADGSIKTNDLLAGGTEYTLAQPTYPLADGATNELTVTFVDGYDYTKIAGKTIVLTFKGKLKDDVTEDDIKAFKDSKIPNKAILVFNGKPGDPSTVTITPPKDPTVDKKVNGKKEVSLDGAAMSTTGFTYTVTAEVPFNVKGMKKFVLEDKLKDVLLVNQDAITAKVDGKPDDQGKINIALANNVVTATIDGADNIALYKGKTITLTIPAKVDANKDLSAYLVEGKLPNTVALLINGQSKATSEATVTPLTGSVSLIKVLKGVERWSPGTEVEFRLEQKIGDDWVPVKGHEHIVIKSSQPFTISDLLPGKYRFVETKAPEGFRMASPAEFDIIGSADDTIPIEVVNHKDTLEKTVDKPVFDTGNAQRQFTITVPVSDVDGMTSFVIEDTIDPFFKLVSGSLNTVLVNEDETEAAEEGIAMEADADGHALRLDVPSDKLDKLADKTVKITYSVTLADGFNYNDLPKSYKDEGIPNEAKLIVNNDPNPKTATKKVKVPVGDITLTKTGDGQALPQGTSATFELYQVVGTIDDDEADTLIDTYTTKKKADKDVIEVKNLLGGSYYFKETVAPQGYVLDSTPREFAVEVSNDGQVSVTKGANFGDNFTVDNVTSDIPTPKKYVKEKEAGTEYTNTHLELSGADKTFTYKVEVPFTKVDGWTEFTITDEVDTQLTVENLKVTIGDKEYTSSNAVEGMTFTNESNMLTFKIAGIDKVKAILGNSKKVVMTFDARINNLTEYLKAHPDAVVGNIAKLNVGHGPKASNKVDVTPPGETPTPVKSIDNDDQGNVAESTTTKRLGKKDQSFFYDVRIQVPNNVTGYKNLTLSDTLEKVLNTEQAKVKVYVNDIEDDALKENISVTETEGRQKVELKLDEQFDYTTLAGKTLRLNIEASFKEGLTDKDLAPYMVKGEARVPNKAELTIDGVSKTSNEVNVTPPGDEPTVEKKVNNSDNVNLTNKTDEFTFTVKTDVPQNVEGYTSIVLEDTLDPALQVAPGENKVSVDWPAGYEGTKPDPVIDGQKVSLTINSDFDKLAGKSVTMKITAKIKDGISDEHLAQNYGKSQIPNEATLVFKGKDKESKKVTSNKVTVTPPSEDPEPVKTVNGKEAETLSNIEDTFAYDISYTVPTNLRDLDRLTLSDTLEKVLETKENKSDITVYVNNVKDDELTDGVELATAEEKQTITLDLKKGIFFNRTIFEDLAGKTIRLHIVAKIKEGADLSGYTNRTVPNQANLVINDRTKPSKTVTVTPPKGSVTLTKYADGAKLKGEQSATFELYKQVGEIDNETNNEAASAETKDIPIKNGESDTWTANHASGSQITVTDLEPGNYYFIETAAPDGYEVDATPQRFTIEKNQKVTVSLPMNNVSSTTPTKTVNHEKAIDISDYDKAFTYRVNVPVGSNTDGMNKIVITDTVNDLLEIVDGSAKVTDHRGNEVTGGTAKIDGKTITYTKEGDFSSLKNSTLTLAFDAKLKAGVTKEELGDYLTNDGIPNEAKVTFNDNPSSSKDTNDVHVKPLLGSVELTKTADGEALPAGKSAQFDLYKVIGDIDDANNNEGAGENKDSKVNDKVLTTENGKITVTDLVPGKYYFKEVTAPVGYQLKKEPIEVTIVGGKSNKATVDNTSVNVPTPEKKVKAADADDSTYDDHLDLSALNQEIAYKITVNAGDTTALTKFELSDKVDDLLEVVAKSAEVKIDEAEATSEGVSISGKAVTYTAADLSAIKDKDITLTFKAKVRDGLTAEDLKAAYGGSKIPNKATLTFNDDPKLSKDSNRVTVTPTFGEVTLTKKSDGNPLPSNLSATFELYKEKTGLLGGDDKIGSYRTDENGKITVKDLAVGKYYFVETVAPAGHILDATPRTFVVNADRTVEAGENFADFIVNNVTPKDGPSIDKKIVDGEERVEHKDLSKLDEKVTYEVKVEIPDTVDGYNKMVITDHPDEKLTVEDIAVKIDDTGDITNNADYGSLNGNSYTFKDGFDYKSIAGKTVIMTVTAKLKEAGVKVPNKAGLTFNSNPEIFSEPVTVTPPGDKPTPHKDVDGQSELRIGYLDQTFVFNVNYEVPANVTGYTSLELTDTIPKILEVVSKEVQVAGVRKTNLETDTHLTVDDNQKVTFKLADGYDFTAIAGKKVNLAIRAKIKDGATKEELKPFLTEGIKNQAHLSFNGGEGKPTEEVKVIPPGDGPTVKKEVLNTDGNNSDKEKLALKKKDEPYKYHVITTVPKNVNGYKTIVLSDTLKDVLQAPKADAVKVLIDGEDKTTDFADKIQVDGQTVSLTLEKKLIGGFDFETVAGKTITMVIPANIKKDAVLSKNAKSEVPNKATLTFNGRPIPSNEVTVIPPGETPKPQKDVNGKAAETIADKATSFTYNLSYTVPENLNGIESIELYDKLEKVLETKDDKSGITIKVDDTPKDAWKDKVSIETIDKDGDDKDKTQVTLTLAAADLAGLEGKTIHMAIAANIKANADLTGYTNNTIPNKAEITINDGKGHKATPNVPVTLKGSVDIPVTKVWAEGSKVKESATFYVVKADNQTAADAMTEANKIGDYLIVSAKTNWKGSFKNLDKYDAAGKEITYFVKEEPMDGYEVEITKDDETGKVTVTNTEKDSDKPTLDKKVQDVKEYKLQGSTEQVIYTMDITVPETTKDITKLHLTDTLPAIMKVAENASVKVTKENLDKDALAALQDKADAVLQTDGQTITWSIVGKDKVKEFAGSTITVSVKAALDESKDLSSFLVEGKIPNTSTLSYNNDPSNDLTSEAKVVPPSDGPTIEKKVQGADKYALTDLFEAHEYTIKTSVPEDTSSYKEIRVTDKLPDILEIVDGTLTIKAGTIDVFNDINTYGSFDADHATDGIQLVIDKNFTDFQGKDIVITFEAKVRSSATDEELEPYRQTEPNSIQNTAKLVFTNLEDEKVDKYSTVTVTPPHETTEVQVEKRWMRDAETTIAEEDMPSDLKEIHVFLFKENSIKVFKHAKVTKDAGWKATFTDLPKYDDKGKLIAYHVEEVPVNGFDGTVANKQNDAGEDLVNDFIITNTQCETTKLIIDKVWVDGNNSQGTRPKTLSFRAVQWLDGEKTGKTFPYIFDVTEDNRYEWTGLPKYGDDDNEFAYTVEEGDIAGYKSTVEPDKEDPTLFKVTNTYGGTMDVPFEKVWIGGENHPEVTFTLYAGEDPAIDKDGNPLTKTIPANATGEDLKGSFTDLRTHDDDGNAITYSIRESSVDGYTSTVFGKAKCGFTILNIADDFDGVSLLKVDSKTKAVLEGAEFELYKKAKTDDKKDVDTADKSDRSNNSTENSTVIESKVSEVGEEASVASDHEGSEEASAAESEEDDAKRVARTLKIAFVKDLIAALEEANAVDAEPIESATGSDDSDLESSEDVALENIEVDENAESTVEDAVEAEEPVDTATPYTDSVDALFTILTDKGAEGDAFDALKDSFAEDGADFDVVPLLAYIAGLPEDVQQDDAVTEAAEAARTAALNHLTAIHSNDAAYLERLSDRLKDFEKEEDEEQSKVLLRNSEATKEGATEENAESESEGKGEEASSSKEGTEKTEDTLIGTYTTDANGLILVEKLSDGDYYFKEKTAPNGYKKSDEPFDFKLPLVDGKPVVVVVENDPTTPDKPNNPPNTPDDPDDPNNPPGTTDNPKDPKHPKDPSTTPDKPKDSKEDPKKDPKGDPTTPEDKKNPKGDPNTPEDKKDPKEDPNIPEDKKEPTPKLFSGPNTPSSGTPTGGTPTDGGKPSTPSTRTTSPKTYDAGIAGYLVLIFLGIGGLAVVERRKRNLCKEKKK